MKRTRRWWEPVIATCLSTAATDCGRRGTGGIPARSYLTKHQTSKPYSRIFPAFLTYAAQNSQNVLSGLFFM